MCSRLLLWLYVNNFANSNKRVCLAILVLGQYLIPKVQQLHLPIFISKCECILKKSSYILIVRKNSKYVELVE